MITIWIPVIYACLAQNCNFYYKVGHHTNKQHCEVELEQKKDDGAKIGYKVVGICVAAQINPDMFSEVGKDNEPNN